MNETISVNAKGLCHSFKNLGSKPAKVLAIATPSGPEQFFEEVGQLVNLPMNPEQEHNLISTQSKSCQHVSSRIEGGVMSFLKRFSNSTTRLNSVVFLLLTFTALPALADNCSPNDRAPLPPCVQADYVNNGAILTNRCPYKVTIKVDIANGSDQRVDVPANGGRRVVSTTKRFSLKCCPKYNKCTG